MKQDEPILGGNSNLISEVRRGAEVAEVKEIYLEDVGNAEGWGS